MKNNFKLLPYHLSIILIIKEIDLREVFFIKDVIKKTELPNEVIFYDLIIYLWKKRMKELHFLDSTGVVENLVSRKEMIGD